MTSSIRSAASALAMSLALALAGGARADSPNLAATRVAVEAAQRSYEQRNFEDAIIAFTSAYELSGLPAMLFNLGQCHRQLKHYERAAFFYRGFLAQQPPPIEEEALVRGLLAEMEEAAAQQPPFDLTAALAPRPLALEPAAVPAQALPALPTPGLPEQALAEPSIPLVRQWWLWTIVGAAITGGAVAAGVLASESHPAPAPTLGDIHF